MPKFTKADLTASLYEKIGAEKQEIRLMLDNILDEIKGALMRGDTVELRGFGTFEVRYRKGRSKARNPRTGEPVQVASHGIAAFRPGRELKEKVWNLPESHFAGPSPEELEAAARQAEKEEMPLFADDPSFAVREGTESN
jgi:integration host factor subunit beta